MKTVLGIASSSISGPDAFASWLRYGVLKRWSTSGVDHRGQCFYEALDSAGRFVRAPARLRTHARQIYSFATAYRLGWGAGYATLATLGIRWLGAFRRPDGYYADCPQAGRFEANLYEQAFVLLALAAVAQAGIEPCMQAFENEARGITDRILTSSAGRIVREPETGLPAQANACMHLLEALLAWHSVAGAAWKGLATNVAEDAYKRLADPQTELIVEPDCEGAGPGRCEPGHLYEWSVLFDTIAHIVQSTKFSKRARRLFSFAETHGSGHSGQTFNAVWPDGRVLDPGARLWPQCERLKAIDHFQQQHNSAAAWAALSLHIEGCQTGLWHERLEPGLHPLRPAPAPTSSLYHLMSLQSQLHPVDAVEPQFVVSRA
jgi:mannose-6-phosphate isomerase